MLGGRQRNIEETLLVLFTAQASLARVYAGAGALRLF